MTTIKHTMADAQVSGGLTPSMEDGSTGRALASASKPTDLELMLYFDGELDEARCKEVEAYLERDAIACDKLSGLHLVSGAVRNNLAVSDQADGIADAVMAKIAASKETTLTESLVRQSQVDRQPARLSKGLKPRAVNDNARGIFTLAAFAVAAAAAMMIWGRMENEPALSSQKMLTGPEATSIEQIQVAPVDVQPAEAPAPEGDLEHGVEVAAVDFGAHMGTIFYVPRGISASNSTTTVVWVDDDAAGEKK